MESVLDLNMVIYNFFKLHFSVNISPSVFKHRVVYYWKKNKCFKKDEVIVDLICSAFQQLKNKINLVCDIFHAVLPLLEVV